MRSLISVLLTGLILACPIVCGADEVGHQVQHEHGVNGDSPDQCPESSDNCVCRGAVASSDARVGVALGLEVSAPSFYLAPPLHFSHPLHHLTWGGSPTGLAGWGDSLTIRALLQNFRC